MLIQDYLDICDPVLTFDRFMGGIELEKYLKNIPQHYTGRLRYDPVSMLKTVLFGFMANGYISLRELEDQCKVNLRFMYLMDHQTPSYRTFGYFINEVLADSIEEIFQDINKKIFETEHVDLQHLYIDGSKFEANANKYSWVWKKSTEKSRYRVFDKITTLFAEINEELTCTGIKLCINSEYAPEYLKEAAEQYAEAWQIDETAFVHGRGHRKTTQQRHYEKLREYAAKLEEYVEKIKICGEDRNSYSKTDHSATFMRIKTDYMGNDQLLPAYNVQVIDGGELNVGATTKDVVNITKARDEINKRFLISAINWQIEGVSLDNLNRVKATKDFIGFERQKRAAKNALTILPADRETQGVLEAFLAYVTLGNGSWNFDDSAMMVYRVQNWVEKWKKTIIQTVNVFDNQSVDYQDCAIATEMIREIMQGVFTGTKVEGIPITNLMAKNLKKAVQNSHCTEWNSLVSMLLNNDEKVKDVITQYYNIIQGNLKSSQVFIRATEFNSDVRKVQKAKLLIPDEQILLNDPIPQRREIREIYEKIYTRIPKVAEAEKEKANRLLEQIGMYLDYEDIDDEDIEDLIDKIKDFYATASNSLVNIHGNIQVLDGIKKDAKTISVAFGEVEKGIASTDDIDTLLMFSKDPLTKLERVLSILQTVQKDIEYVARDVEKRRGNILVDNGGDLSTRYVELRNKIELDSKTIMDWKVM